MDPAAKFTQYANSFLKNSGPRSISHRMVRHLVAGGIGTLLYMGVVFLLVEAAGLRPVYAVVISFLFFELFIYVINRAWVYHTVEGHAHAVPRFILITALTLILNTGLMYIAVDVFNLSYLVGLAATVVIIPPTNFLLNYYWAFR
jgi:putative flippase GtrA